MRGRQSGLGEATGEAAAQLALAAVSAPGGFACARFEWGWFECGRFGRHWAQQRSAHKACGTEKDSVARVLPGSCRVRDSPARG